MDKESQSLNSLLYICESMMFSMQSNSQFLCVKSGHKNQSHNFSISGFCIDGVGTLDVSKPVQCSMAQMDALFKVKDSGKCMRRGVILLNKWGFFGRGTMGLNDRSTIKPDAEPHSLDFWAFIIRVIHIFCPNHFSKQLTYFWIRLASSK